MTSEKRTIVTGAGGYLGRHVVNALLDRGHQVTAILRPGSEADVNTRAHVARLDVLQDDIEPLVKSGMTTSVVHLAWKDGFSHNAPSHMKGVSAHYEFLTRLGHLKVDRIVALGTMHEVGYWEGAVDGDTPTSPLSQYGIAKEALRRSVPLALDPETSFAWARAYYIYGDDRRNNSIFRKLLEAVDAGRNSFPFTTGRNLYDFIRVEELGHQLAALTDAPELVGTINCSSGTPVSLADKVEEFIRLHDLPITLEYGAFPDRPYDSPGTWGDATIIRELMAREAQ